MMTNQREIKAELTRERILEASAEEIRRVGFRAASLSDILAKLGISKGALYHHFPDKLTLGYAVLDECFGKAHRELWRSALNSNTNDPIAGVVRLLTEKVNMDCRETLCCGCPLNNLATEMSPVDEGFRARIESIYRFWHEDLARALRSGQSDGTIRTDLDADEVAYFIVASIQGATGLAKNAQDYGLFRNAIQGLLGYLGDLRVKAA